MTKSSGAAPPDSTFKQPCQAVIASASEAIHSRAGKKLDCFDASAPSGKRFAVVAGNDVQTQSRRHNLAISRRDPPEV
jgi:hypothetical protein